MNKVSKATGDKPEVVDGYVHFLWNSTEDVKGEDPNYWQKVTISNLDKYDEYGDEIQYYAKESMSVTNPGDLDYTDVTFSDAKVNYTYEGQFIEGTEMPEDVEFKIYIGKETEEDKKNADYDNWIIHAGGTFVNHINSPLVANGTKIWQNVPGDFNLNADMPEITVYLQRRLASATGDWDTPKIVKKGEGNYTGNEDTVIWNSEDSAASDYGVVKKCADGSEIVAYTVTFKKDSNNQWSYQLWHVGLNGENDDATKDRLPKYDENGNLYQYRALEAMWGLYGSDGWDGTKDIPSEAVRSSCATPIRAPKATSRFARSLMAASKVTTTPT